VLHAWRVQHILVSMLRRIIHRASNQSLHVQWVRASYRVSLECIRIVRPGMSGKTYSSQTNHLNQASLRPCVSTIQVCVFSSLFLLYRTLLYCAYPAASESETCPSSPWPKPLQQPLVFPALDTTRHGLQSSLRAIRTTRRNQQRHRGQYSRTDL